MTSRRRFPTAARLRRALTYDPATGVFTWRQSRGKASKGKPAGSVTTIGGKTYRQIGLDGRLFYASTAAFIIMTGGPPSGPVTYRDGNSLNVAWGNLQVTTESQIQHVTPQRPGRSGVQGVRWDSKRRVWLLSAKMRGRRIHGGTYREVTPAAADYLALKDLIRGFLQLQHEATHP